MTALERRFGRHLGEEGSREELTSRCHRENETLGTFAADVRFDAQRGYPQFPTAALDELALHAFLQGLTPERLRQHVRLSRPHSLTEALQEAERTERILIRRSTPASTYSSPCRGRQAILGEQEETEEVFKVQPATPGRRRRAREDRCYRCDEPGHVPRDCPVGQGTLHCHPGDPHSGTPTWSKKEKTKSAKGKSPSRFDSPSNSISAITKTQ